jgi:hypothetical protein
MAQTLSRSRGPKSAAGLPRVRLPRAGVRELISITVNVFFVVAARFVGAGEDPMQKCGIP